jgi:hypothetical protein
MQLPLTDPDTLFEELLQDLPPETAHMGCRGPCHRDNFRNGGPAFRYHHFLPRLDPGQARPEGGFQLGYGRRAHLLSFASLLDQPLAVASSAFMPVVRKILVYPHLRSFGCRMPRRQYARPCCRLSHRQCHWASARLLPSSRLEPFSPTTSRGEVNEQNSHLVRGKRPALVGAAQSRRVSTRTGSCRLVFC